MNVGNPSLSALVAWLNFKLCVFLNSNKMKHAIHFQCGRLCGRSTSGILHCICGLIKQNRKSLLRSFPAVYTTSFVFCALGRSLTNFFQQPSAPRHSRHFNIFQSQKLNINFPPNRLHNSASFNSGGSMLIQTIFTGWCCSFFSNFLEEIWITGEEIPSWSLLGVRTLLKWVPILHAT